MDDNDEILDEICKSRHGMVSAIIEQNRTICILLREVERLKLRLSYLEKETVHIRKIGGA